MIQLVLIQRLACWVLAKHFVHMTWQPTGASCFVSFRYNSADFSGVLSVSPEVLVGGDSVCFSCDFFLNMELSFAVNVCHWMPLSHLLYIFYTLAINTGFHSLNTSLLYTAHTHAYICIYSILLSLILYSTHWMILSYLLCIFYTLAINTRFHSLNASVLYTLSIYIIYI